MHSIRAAIDRAGIRLLTEPRPSGSGILRAEIETKRRSFAPFRSIYIPTSDSPSIDETPTLIYECAVSSSTVSSLLRADQAYYAQLAETHALDWGIAFVSNTFPLDPNANQFREVMLEPGTSAADALAAVNAFFESRARRCCKWVSAANVDDADLHRHLTAQGYTYREVRALLLTEWIDVPIPDGVRILPARAMRKALAAIHTERFESADAAAKDLLCQAAQERLNDPRMDAFVAMLDDQPAGCCTLFEIGDIGRICDLYVCKGDRRRAVGRALVGQVLRLAKRLLLRVVCAPVAADNAPALKLFASCGLRPDGSIAEFVTPGVTLFDG